MLDSIKTKCEVVVVLNGTTDEVRKIVQEYKKSKIFSLKIVEIPERNLSKSRNIGMQNATYKKVVFYDSDCVITDKALEYYDEYLDKYLLVDGYVKFRNDKFSSKIISIQRSMGLPGYALCPSIGIHKDIINKIGYYFDEDIKWIEDSELNIRAKKQNIEVGIIDRLTCIHDNLSFKQDLKSAYRYGCGVKVAANKGLHKKRPTANWNLIIPCFKKRFLSGIYCIIWNIVYCYGYYFGK
jgi:glycosyltransferase involved in cell wall biosynthesis